MIATKIRYWLFVLRNSVLHLSYTLTNGSFQVILIVMMIYKSAQWIYYPSDKHHWLGTFFKGQKFSTNQEICRIICIKIFISVINELDTQNFCFTCFEHMCSKHVEAWNKLIVKQKFCASSWLITEINILRCTVSKTSKKCIKIFTNILRWTLFRLKRFLPQLNTPVF